MSRYYTIDDIANNLRVSPRTAQRWIKARRLRAHRFGRTVRVAEEDLIAFLKNRQDDPAEYQTTSEGSEPTSVDQGPSKTNNSLGDGTIESSQTEPENH